MRPCRLSDFELASVRCIGIAEDGMGVTPEASACSDSDTTMIAWDLLSGGCIDLGAAHLHSTSRRRFERGVESSQILQHRRYCVVRGCVRTREGCLALQEPLSQLIVETKEVD